MSIFHRNNRFHRKKGSDEGLEGEKEHPEMTSDVFRRLDEVVRLKKGS